jgi:hypothetical protein
MIFAANPCNINGVAWLNGIGYSLCGTCALVMILNQTFMFIPYFLTLWLHVVSFTAPFYILVCHYSHLNALYAVILVIGYLIVGKLFKWQLPLAKVQKNATVVSRWNEVKAERFKAIDFRKLIFVIRTYSFYFWKGVFPLRLGLYPTFGYGYGVIKQETKRLESIDGVFIFDFLTVCMNVFLITKFWGSPISQGLLFWNILIAPFLNLIILQQTIADRYCYVPNIGLSVAVASALNFTPMPSLFFGLYIGMLATKLWLFLPAYKSMDALIDHNLYDYPTSEAGWNWKGVLENVNGRFFSSIHYWAIGLRHEPNSFRLNFNISQALAKMGLVKEAKVYFDQAERGLPEDIVKANEETLRKSEEAFMQRLNIKPQDKPSRQVFNFKK